jgi:peroxiredoxin
MYHSVILKKFLLSFNRSNKITITQLATLLLLLIGVSHSSEAMTTGGNQKDTTLLLSGKYFVENLYVQQEPFEIKSIKVNGQKVKDTVFEAEIYEIRLKSFHLKEEDAVQIEIVYALGRPALAVLNELALKQYPLFNQKLPVLAGKDVNGKDINTASLLGKVVVLNAWFVGCKPCEKEMPGLNDLVKKYKGQNVLFIAPCLSATDKIKEFLLQHAFDYSIVADSKVYCKEKLECSKYPVNIVINKKGEIIYYSGYAENTAEILMRKIDKALKE